MLPLVLALMNASGTYDAAAETGGSLQARLDAAAADGMPPLEADDDDDDIGEPLGAPQAFEPSSAGVK